MKKLTLSEIHNMELELLDEFSKFCNKNNLRFYLAGGTLLGAVRHKGFIPWDDDIDILMPRPDYQEFVNIFVSKGNIALFCMERGNMTAPFAKLKKMNTIVFDASSTLEADINTHLWIDIIPVDGIPEGSRKTKKIYSKALLWRRMLVLRVTKYGVGKNILEKTMKLLVKLCLSFFEPRFFSEKLDNISKTYDYSSAKFVGAVSWGLYGEGEKMEKLKFEKTIYKEFEGRKMPIFSCWNEYLTNLYGDYMKLPPVERRVGHKMDIYMI